MRKILTIIALIASSFCCLVSAQEKGKASYYAKRMNGARTASGSRLHNDSLECAHKTHPFGTLLLVKNPANGKEIIVKVVDRGPHGRGRIVDLTYEAARQLGIVTQGIAAVEVSVYNDEHGIPYRHDKPVVPEIDLEITEVPDTLVTPEWQQQKKH